VPLVVVHGGGREIDAALARAGIQKRQVEGLRITDAATLGVVVEVLAGAVNTRLVAAINSAGGRAVGLTGADALSSEWCGATDRRSEGPVVICTEWPPPPTAGRRLRATERARRVVRQRHVGQS